MKKNNKKNKIRCCLNCKNWRIYTQNRFVCRGVCDISYGSTRTSKDFCCGKFELTKELQKTLDEIEQARKENQFKMTDEGYLKNKEDLLPYELACGMYYGPPNGEPLKIYRENDFGEWNDIRLFNIGRKNK